MYGRSSPKLLATLKVLGFSPFVIGDPKIKENVHKRETDLHVNIEDDWPTLVNTKRRSLLNENWIYCK